MAAAVSKSKQRVLAWSGTVEDLFVIHDSLQRQSTDFLGPVDVSGEPDYLQESEAKRARRLREVRVQVEDPDMNTTVSGTLPEVLADPDTDISRAVHISMTLGSSYDATASAELSLRRTGFRSGATLETVGPKAKVLSLEANVWRSVKSGAPWWRFMCHYQLSTAFAVLSFGTFMVVGAILDSSNEGEPAETNWGLSALAIVAVIGLAEVTARLLRRFVFPPLEIYPADDPPQSRRFRFLFWASLASAGMSIAVASTVALVHN